MGRILIGNVRNPLANNLTTAEASKYALDASQGKALDDKKIDKSSIVNNAATTVANTVLDGRMGKTLQDSIDTLNRNMQKQNRVLWTGKINSGYITCDMSPYTYIIIDMGGVCAMTKTGGKTASATSTLYTGTKYIPGIRNVVFDYYPDHLYVHDVFDADLAGSEYRDGRFVTTVIGVL